MRTRHLLSLSTVAAASFTLAPMARAQQPMPDQATAVEIRSRFLSDLDSLQSKFLQLANAFPDDKYGWRPGPGVRSVAEVFMHVASEYYLYTPLAYGGTRSPVIPRQQGGLQTFEKSASAKSDVLKHLNDSFAYTKQQLNALTPAQITGTQKLFGRDMTIVETTLIMSDDLHEHLGQLIAYARMNGIVPPWSK